MATNVRRRSSMALSVLMAGLIVGCSTTEVRPPPTSTGAASPGPGAASISPAPSATPSPSPSPSPVASPSPTTASIEQDGVRLTMMLDRDPMPAGESTWISTKVENTGKDDLFWWRGGCRILVSIHGELAGPGWRPGTQQQGTAKTYKDAILDRGLGAASGGPLSIRFAPAEYSRYRPIVCTTELIRERIAPGNSLEQRVVWDGDVESFMGPPSSGSVELMGSFGDYTRGEKPAPTGTLGSSVTTTLDTRIVDGRTPDLLDPPEVIDAALADTAFATFVGVHDVNSAADPVFRYDTADGMWHVGMLLFEPYRLHVVLIDPRTGEVHDTVDRPWSTSEGPP